MSHLPSVDIVALLERLRGEKAMIEQDIATLEGALAVAERHTSASGATSTPPAPSPDSLAPAVLSPMPPPRRIIPKIPASVERPSDERIAELAQAVRGMTQIEALEFMGRHMDGFQNADAVKVIIAAGLTTGKRSNVSSHVYRLLSESEKFEKVGPGRFRLIAQASQEPVTQDIPAGDQQEGVAPFPLFSNNREDTTM